MKKTIILLACAALLVACSSTPTSEVKTTIDTIKVDTTVVDTLPDMCICPHDSTVVK